MQAANDDNVFAYKRALAGHQPILIIMSFSSIARKFIPEMEAGFGLGQLLIGDYPDPPLVENGIIHLRPWEGVVWELSPV